MSDINKIKLLECLKKEADICTKEKFNEKKTRFYLGRETALTDIIVKIESGQFDFLTESGGESRASLITTIESQKEKITAHQRSLTAEAIKNANLEKRMKAYELQAIININLYEDSQEQIESLKAITELAVKGLKEIACLNVDSDYSAGTFARNTLSEIERLSQ